MAQFLPRQACEYSDSNHDYCKRAKHLTTRDMKLMHMAWWTYYIIA